jgi:mRNA-degrading endonuclease toxin of MazEF toxin-antitoxin module
MEISKELINNTFEIDKLKQIKEQLLISNNLELLKLVEKKLKYNRWELIWVDLGTPESKLNKDTYTKYQIINDLKGVNLGVEFSLFHPAVIISPHFLNKEKVNIIPITSFENHNCKYDNLYCLEKYELLNHKSVLLIDQITTVSTKRIIRHKKRTNNKEVIIYLTKEDKNHLIKKMSKILLGFDCMEKK